MKHGTCLMNPVMSWTFVCKINKQILVNFLMHSFKNKPN